MPLSNPNQTNKAMPNKLDLSNIYTDLKHGAALANTNLSQLCEDAQVNRSTVEQWKDAPPRIFDIVTRLGAALEAAALKSAPESAAE